MFQDLWLLWSEATDLLVTLVMASNSSVDPWPPCDPVRLWAVAPQTSKGSQEERGRTATPRHSCSSEGGDLPLRPVLAALRQGCASRDPRGEREGPPGLASRTGLGKGAAGSHRNQC